MENFRRKSFWLETAGEFEPQPELKGDVKTDIAIIGGGFTGLSTAYHIKKIDPSIDVAIVENQICGYGASGRNAGFGMTLFGLTFSLTARNNYIFKPNFFESISKFNRLLLFTVNNKNSFYMFSINMAYITD